jgi:ABC-type phosphate/phosphonate transport system permease subunit
VPQVLLDETQIRSRIGLVGAGGIGVALDSAMNNLYWDQVGLILAIIFTVVIITEIVTSSIRSRIL